MTTGHPAAYNHTFSIQTSQFILCSNAIPIENQTIWGAFLWLSVARPQNHTPQLVHVPHTCSNVSVAANKHLIHFNISFPELPNCNRRRRAWYDTLLGGLSSGFGVVNSIDLEALASRLRQTGSDTAKTVTLNTQWLPTSITPNSNTLK